MTAVYRVGDVFDRLAEIPDGSVDLVITSPPFLALRSYLPADHPDKGKEIGSEETPAAFLDVMLAVMAELRRVTAEHGSVCIELGDTYAGSGGAGGDYAENGWREGQESFGGSGKLANYNDQRGNPDGMRDPTFSGANTRTGGGSGWPLAKSRALIPELFRVALAYGINPLTGQESPAGKWLVRNVVTWCRPNPPVGALGDKWRPATSDVVVACTSAKRYWDDLATRKQWAREYDDAAVAAGPKRQSKTDGSWSTLGDWPDRDPSVGAPLLDYWEIPPTGYKGAHYAVYPPALVEPLVKAMAPPAVCKTCGEPRRRIVEVDGLTGRDFKAAVTGENDRSTGLHGPRTMMPENITRTTSGWTDCPCPDPVTPSPYNGEDEPGPQTSLRVATESAVGVSGSSKWRPGLILDPFAGSGTTLLVATGHGHDAIGIDLDARNAELALDRVGPFLMEVEA